MNCGLRPRLHCWFSMAGGEVSKTEEIVPRRGDWTKAAAAFANEQIKPGTNWRVKGMRLLDLEQVDADLARWTTFSGDQ